MGPQQKEALLTIVATLAAGVLFFTVQFFFREHLALFSLVILAVLIVTVWIFRLVFGVRRTVLDERDFAIRYQSGIIAFFAFSAFFMLGCMGMIYKFYESQFVPILYVILLMFFSWIVLYLTWAVSTLVQYRQGE